MIISLWGAFCQGAFVRGRMSGGLLSCSPSLCINLEICSYKYDEIKWKTKNIWHRIPEQILYPLWKLYRYVDKIDTAKTQNHDRLLSWSSTDTSIKVAGLSYIFPDKTNKWTGTVITFLVISINISIIVVAAIKWIWRTYCESRVRFLSVR